MKGTKEMTQSAEIRRTPRIRVGCCRVFKQIGTICLAFVLSIFSTLSFADNAVTGSGTECVYSTLNTYTGPSTIKANWDPNTINLYWYNDDTQTSSNTCNYDGSISLPATNPTKTGYTFTGWEVVGGVPAGYTMLEYIQSSGTQWIDTGFLPNQNSRWEINILMPSLSTAAASFGSAGNSFGIYGGNTTYTIATLYNGSYTYFDPARYISANVLYNLNLDKNVFTATFENQSYTKTHTAATFTANTTLKIFMLDAFSTTRYGKFRLYSSKLYDNGVLVQNLIPAKRNNDSVVGMWDTVSGTFKTNAGSGTFTAGPAIQ